MHILLIVLLTPHVLLHLFRSGGVGALPGVAEQAWGINRTLVEV